MVVILFGVSGAGKTHIGSLLARELGWSFYEGDTFHAPEAIERMRQGIPLTDAERGPWLERLRRLIERLLERGENAVLACSALKAAYRDRLRASDDVRFVHLAGDFDLIASRLRHRHGHYMHPDLLASQFADLEAPSGAALVVDISSSPEEIVRRIRTALDV